jgi:hypothetical protein
MYPLHLTLSPIPSYSTQERYGFLPSRIPLGVLENDGGTSIAGFCVKKFLGRSNTDMGSAGMIG